jgi:Ca2+:H+ antiporter
VPSRDCRRCYFSQIPAFDDRFYIEAVRPYCWFAATLLFLSYIIGLWFTLRTHAAVIWNNEVDEKKIHSNEPSQILGAQQLVERTSRSLQQRQPPISSSETTRNPEIRDSQLYKKFMGQSLKQGAAPSRTEDLSTDPTSTGSLGPTHGDSAPTPHMVPPRDSRNDTARADGHFVQFSDGNSSHAAQMAEFATPATDTTQNATDSSRKGSKSSPSIAHGTQSQKSSTLHAAAVPNLDGEIVAVDVAVTGAHDAPNWSRTKSSVILMGATILYALIAEILVDTVDVVLKGFAVDEKFLGITLFALVPNTTEFLVSLLLPCASA